MTFGAVVRQLREERGLSQAEVARRAGIDEQSRVSEIEREKSEPSISRARQVARGMGVMLTELVARWEDVELVWVKASAGARKATAEAKGANNATDLERDGATMRADDDLGQSLLSSLGLCPEERRLELVRYVFNMAATWRDEASRRATGTHPKD